MTNALCHSSFLGTVLLLSEDLIHNHLTNVRDCHLSLEHVINAASGNQS